MVLKSGKQLIGVWITPVLLSYSLHEAACAERNLLLVQALAQQLFPAVLEQTWTLTEKISKQGTNLIVKEKEITVILNLEWKKKCVAKHFWATWQMINVKLLLG